MTRCLKCKTENEDAVKFCLRCGSSILEPIVPPGSQTPGGEVRSGTPKTVKLVRLTNPAGVTSEEEAMRVRQEAVRSERDRLISDAERERRARERIEEEFEEYKTEMSGRLIGVDRLRSEAVFLKKYGKIALGIAGGLILLLFILTIAGFSGSGKREAELSELRPFKERYDSAALQLRLINKELDSLRLALIESGERYEELRAAGQSRGRGAVASSSGNVYKSTMGIEMVFVRGGQFAMGCTSEQGKDCSDDEKPVSGVTLKNYSIGKYPVTQGQWRQVMGSNPSRYRGDKRPVEQVSWRDAQEFITRLNNMTGMRYRLPTEAEWEYAARGGSGGAGFRYAGSHNADEVAWYGQSNGTAAVGGKRPNELGVFDMSGNVSEWVSDRYGRYSGGDKVNPSGSTSGNDRVFRGGSWTNMAARCRVSARGSLASGAKSNYVGFRLAHSE